GVHKYYGDEIRNEKSYEPWWENDARIPLIIYNSTVQGKRIDTTGGQLDVLPTLCYLTGIDPGTYERNSMGRNLLNTDKDFVLLNDGRIVTPKNIDLNEKERILQSFDISELVIRGDYFHAVQARKNGRLVSLGARK
ncbi:MAG TPA: hypothetical protein VF857_08785, partial [Spirochaetota bacterium]